MAVAVPRGLQALFGCKIIRQPLGTMSHELAERLKHEHVARIKGWFREAELTGRVPEDIRPLDLTDIIMITREEVKKLRDRGEWDEAAELINLTADDIEERRSVSEAGQFVRAMAASEETTVTSVLEEWLNHSGAVASTIAERRKAVHKFIDWITHERGVSRELVTFDMVDLRTAYDYMVRGLEGMHPATKKKHVGALRVLWTWAASLDHYRAKDQLEARANPWRSRKDKLGTTPKPEKRPFKNDELAQLLQAAEDLPRYSDVLTVLALSGMRLAELVTMTVASVDLKQGLFKITKGKTEAATREVPITQMSVHLWRAGCVIDVSTSDCSPIFLCRATRNKLQGMLCRSTSDAFVIA